MKDIFNLKENSRSVALEDILMPLIIKIAQDHGGEIDKKEIDALLPDYDSRFDPGKTIFAEKKGSSGSYRPFMFTRQFSIKNLEHAGFLKNLRGKVELTEKGLRVDPAKIDVQNDIRKIAAPKWAERKSKNGKPFRNTSADEESARSDDIEISDEVDREIEQDAWKDELKRKIDEMDGYKFEKFARGLLAKMGIKIDPEIGVRKSGDGGIDGYGYFQGDDFRTVRVAIQCKRWQGTVGSKDVDALRGSVAKFDAEYGVFITNSYFSREAKRTATTGNMPITLIDGDRLLKLIEKYEYHIIPVKAYELDEFFGE
ncbi:MAG: restriction endonuclease [Candidatus Nomurabacteria bacterium]|jgi:restriction system protein|nr:restriction endonuclease [Candidatus Nomurabacteria bacterium]